MIFRFIKLENNLFRRKWDAPDIGVTDLTMSWYKKWIEEMHVFVL